MKVLFFPKATKGNQYTENMVSILEGVTHSKIEYLPSVVFFIKHFFSRYFRKRADLLVVNWIESFLTNKRGRLSLFGVVKFFVFLVYFRFAAKKIVYVRHNIYPHNANDFAANVSMWIIGFSERFFTKVVSHSDHLSAKGYCYIPHPLYRLSDIKDDLSYQSRENPYFIVFGRIERYKAIEKIICCWDSRNRLLIAGSVGDVDYLAELKALAAGKNINFRAEFLEEREARKLVEESRGLLLSHADEDMIVSGSFFYATTLGVPVYALRTHFLDDLEKKGYLGLKVFQATDEMVAFLSTAGLKTANRASVLKQAEENFGYDVVGQRWQQLLESINVSLYTK